jgi:hypothetical protein
MVLYIIKRLLVIINPSSRLFPRGGTELLDFVILVSVWIVAILLLVLFVPKQKIRDASVIFIFKQAITWAAGLYVVEKHWLEYPINEFGSANRSSFTFEFFAFPSVCVLFNLHYPEEKGWLRQILHYVMFVGTLTILEFFIQKYSDLIRYINWTWYWTFITESVDFYLARSYYRWFRKKWDRGKSYVS